MGKLQILPQIKAVMPETPCQRINERNAETRKFFFFPFHQSSVLILAMTQMFLASFISNKSEPSIKSNFRTIRKMIGLSRKALIIGLITFNM